ncbi:SPOR domain-containing protein [Paracoccaceae bacterium GXU_MW_L88]
MTDIYFEEGRSQNDSGEAGETLAVGAVKWLGAVSAIALVVGVAVWTYKLGARDGSEVPIIRAMDVPARAKPEDVQGTDFPNQNLAVNDVMSDAETSQLPETIELAPSVESLSAEDLPLGELAGADSLESLIPEENAADDLVLAEADLAEEEMVERVDDAEIAYRPRPRPANLNRAAILEARGVTETAPAAAPAIASTDSNPQVTSAERPEEVTLASAEAPQPQPEPAVATKTNTDFLAPEDATAGSWLVQLGAFDSREIAESEWGRIAGKNGDLLGGKSPMIQRIESGGRVFYRLRAVGFQSASAAKQDCSALSARGQACIPYNVK